MIQLLYTYEDESILRGALASFKLPFIKIPEMLDNSYLTLIEPELVSDLEDALKQPPLKMSFVGSYKMNGEQYIWTKPKERQRNHSINKYKNGLKDVVEYDEDGEETSRRRPNENEALDTQVNKIFGWNDRELN